MHLGESNHSRTPNLSELSKVRKEWRSMALDFTFTEEQEFFRQMVRDAVNRLIMPRVAELDEKRNSPGTFGKNLPRWDIWA